MNLQLEIAFSKVPFIEQLTDLKKQIDDVRPFSNDIENRIMQKLRLDWNYNSNAIEGNKLSYGETVALLMHGVTAKGKPLKDHLDIKGHNEAIDYVVSIIKEDRPLTEIDIRTLHEILLVEAYENPAQTNTGQPTTKRIELGKYKSSPNHVQTVTGEIHYYATPEETPAKMEELMDWYAQASSNPDIHPVVIAARFHHKFTAIHPFDDGNGRMSRLLMNLILMKNGYPPAVLKTDDRQNYYSLLSQSDAGDNWPFVEYIAERVQASLNLYLKAIGGENIDDSENIEKKIALFKLEMESQKVVIQGKSTTRLREIIEHDLFSLFKGMSAKINSFRDYFSKIRNVLHVDLSIGHEHGLLDQEFDDNNLNIKLTPNLKSVHSCYFNFHLDELKKDKEVSIDIYWNITFDETKYLISYKNNEVILEKSYAEKITEDEIYRLSDILVDQSIGEMRKYLN